MDFSFNIDAIAEQKASKNREIDSQVSSMESEASRCENQANSFDTQAASMEAMAVAAAARTITVPDGTDSDGHTRYKTIPCPDGQAQAAALKAQAAALKSQAAQLRAHAGAIRGGVSALRSAQTATNKYLDGIVELAQRVDLTNAQKLGQMAADIQQYTKNMTDIMNSFNDSFPLVSKDLNSLEKSVLATVVAKVANDIKQAVNVDEVVRDSLEVLPSEMKSDIEAHAKSLGKNMSELTAGELSGIIEVVASDPKYGEWVNANHNPSTGNVSIEELKKLINNPSLSIEQKMQALLNLGYSKGVAELVVSGNVDIDMVIPESNPNGDPWTMARLTAQEVLVDSKKTTAEKIKALINAGYSSSAATVIVTGIEQFNLLKNYTYTLAPSIDIPPDMPATTPNHSLQNKGQWCYATVTGLYLEAHGLLPSGVGADGKYYVKYTDGIRKEYLGYDPEVGEYYYDSVQAYIVAETNGNKNETNAPRPSDLAITVSSVEGVEGQYKNASGASGVVNKVSELYSYPVIVTVTKSGTTTSHALLATSGGIDSEGNAYLELYDPMYGTTRIVTDETTEFSGLSGTSSIVGVTGHKN